MKFKMTGCCIAILLLLSVPTFAAWNIQYKQDISYEFNAVTFPTSSVGYIVGASGSIYKTIDGGTTWVQQTSPTTATLYDVCATDATHAWAVGSSGVIIYTTDGTTWSLHPKSGVLTTASLYAVQFIGLSGWVGGGVDNVKCQIYFTTDGGTNWSTPTTNPSTDMCNELSFYNANVGYVALDGNGMMYTTDGGVNWTKSIVDLGPYPYTRTDIECVRVGLDAVTAFAAGWGSLVGAQPTIILMTTDGGAHFSCPNTSYPWATYGYGLGWAMFDDGRALVVGGGSTITGLQISAASPYTNWLRDPAFFGYNLNDVCAIPGTTKAVAVGSAGCIALTTDQGWSWTFNYKPGSQFQGQMAMTDFGKDKLMSIGVGASEINFDVANGTFTYGVCSPQGWGPTSMGDVDWVINKRTGGFGPRDSTFNDVVYACGQNNYFVKSYNFGKTWRQLQHDNSNYDALTGMYWFNPDTGIVVGNVQKATARRAEVIYKTTNGGVTLDTVLVRTLKGAVSGIYSFQWNDVDFAATNPSIGVVVGTSNKIRHTSDGGVNWPLATENIVDSTIALTRVHMTSPTIGYACGDKGTVIKTTDGGATWNVLAVPWANTIGLYDCCFRTTTWGWVVGDANMCYYTTDGGTTWTNIGPAAEIPGVRIRTVYYQGPAGILWIGSEYSNVLNRSDAPASTETPKSLPFVLNQNYPNPFNPSTTISFALLTDDHVTLKVYDVNGRLVANVLDKDFAVGKYNIGFKADGLASGVYFYKLKTSTFEETRKMVLLR
jgi:photosystem II stability/assembly factor-like uncharacterized protein